MKKCLAAACGAAIVIAAGIAAAQPQPGTDRKGGESSTQSANPEMDKRANQPNKGSTGKGTAKTPTPPGTDRPSGDSTTTSANPKPDAKK
jgi:hypothetical protein